MQKGKPCDHCCQEVCDYRRCKAYRRWINAAWRQFHHFLPHRYWDEALFSDKKYTYIHPDMVRRYLKEGPCGRCGCAEDCQIPCTDYWYWWDARMAWLRRRLQQNERTAMA